MQQYFYNHEITDMEIKLSKEQAHHIKTVLRMNEFEKVRIVDCTSRLYIGEINYFGKDVYVKNLKRSESNSELSIKITIVAALIKKNKWDFMLQKVSELGAYQIIGLQSKRCVVKLDESKIKKLERWNKITLEACEQARRTYHCKVTDVIGLNEINAYKSELNIVAYEDLSKESVSLVELPKVDSITIVIGPEGGFEDKEIEYLKSQSFQVVQLGQRILRAETAAMYSVAVLGAMYE